MKLSTIRADGLLMITALIWGTAFVFQRTGMDHLGPMAFNGIRFLLGSFALTPLVWLTATRKAPASFRKSAPLSRYVLGGTLAGLALFGGAALQQVGLVSTTAGKAGFITGLYVVVTPLIGLLFAQRPGWGTWAGAALATVGMYLLSVTGGFDIEHGDLLVFIGVFFWSAHLLLIGWLAPKVNPIGLAQAQFFVCGLVSLIWAVFTEPITFEAIMGARNSILYCGLASTGIAYTLQVVAQREANPSHASIILSLEAVFAALAGWLMLGEMLTTRGLVGCGLMLAGMLLSQLRP